VIRLLIADDHAVVRTGLAQLVATMDDVELVGEAADGDEAVALCADRRADVVLMDLEMPRVDGIDATRRIKAAQPEVAVVVLTSFSDRERILSAIDAGAAGYLLKDAPRTSWHVPSARRRAATRRSTRRRHGSCCAHARRRRLRRPSRTASARCC
jgi:DNA-binding NarL/FixJ family response regulator